MNDYILRAISKDGTIRAFVATTKNMVQQAYENQQCTPVVSAALGRLLTAASIMGVMQKNQGDMVTLVVRGDGPVGSLLVTAKSNGNTKGYAFAPHADADNKPNGKLNVSGIVGTGTLKVVKDMGLKEPYNGEVELISGEIAEDLAYYFTQSEQTPSVVSLGVLVERDYSIKQAGGFILQLLPHADEETIEQLENKMKAFPGVTSLLDENNTPEQILDMLLGEFGYEILETMPVAYQCDCSQERVEKVLASLDKSEIETMLKEDGGITVNCHFCNKSYTI